MLTGTLSVDIEIEVKDKAALEEIYAAIRKMKGVKDLYEVDNTLKEYDESKDE